MDQRLIDAKLDAGAELNVTEWRTSLLKKGVSAVENAVVGGWPDREEGWWAAALENAAAPWSRWSTLRRCRHEGAINGEEQTTGS
jgi:hypothetical protein